MTATIDTAIVLYCAIAFALGLFLGWLMFRGSAKRAALEEELSDAEVAVIRARERNVELEREVASVKDQIRPLADEVDRLRVMKNKTTQPAPVVNTAAPVATRDKGVASPEKMPTFLTERPARPDDLQLLKGVGPKMETTLNGMGVYMFAQIADLSTKDMKTIDGKLGAFKGRIERDQLIDQAKLLASGRVTEYEARFGKLGNSG